REAGNAFDIGLGGMVGIVENGDFKSLGGAEIEERLEDEQLIPMVARDSGNVDAGLAAIGADGGFTIADKAGVDVVGFMRAVEGDAVGKGEFAGRADDSFVVAKKGWRHGTRRDHVAFD